MRFDGDMYTVTDQLLDDQLHDLLERVVRVVAVHVQSQLGDDLGVSLRLELVVLGHQELLDVLVVGDDACHHTKRSVETSAAKHLDTSGKLSQLAKLKKKK